MIWLVAIVLLCLLALLAIPLEFRFSVQRDQVTHGELKFCWLFGLVRFAAPIKSCRERPVARETSSKKSDKKPRGNGVRSMLQLSGNARWRQRIFRFAKDLLQTLHLSELSLNLRLGLDDPAETGRLWAFLGPVAVYLSSIRRARIRVLPVFSGESLQLDAHGQAKLVPIQLLYLVLAFILSPVMLHSFWRMHSAGR